VRPDIVPRSETSRTFHATRRQPTYVIKPQTDSSKVPKLLSPHVETTSLALGKTLHKLGGVVKLHIKNDGRGVRIEGVRSDYNNDVFGGIGGRKNLAETIQYLANETSMRVSAIYTDGEANREDINLELYSPNSEVLVISRENLISDCITPELAGYEADPYFGPIHLVDFTFSQLVDAVREKVARSKYILID